MGYAGGGRAGHVQWGEGAIKESQELEARGARWNQATVLPFLLAADKQRRPMFSSVEEVREVMWRVAVVGVAEVMGVLSLGGGRRT